VEKEHRFGIVVGLRDSVGGGRRPNMLGVSRAQRKRRLETGLRFKGQGIGEKKKAKFIEERREGEEGFSLETQPTKRGGACN